MHVNAMRRASSCVRAFAVARTFRRHGANAQQQLALITAFVGGWFLKHGLMMIRRKARKRVLDTIAAQAERLAALLHACDLASGADDAGE
jgi:hypothetical protein